jgi:hypothetical protein
MLEQNVPNELSAQLAAKFHRPSSNRHPKQKDHEVRPETYPLTFGQVEAGGEKKNNLKITIKLSIFSIFILQH